jgi:hypothetical protein
MKIFITLLVALSLMSCKSTKKTSAQAMNEPSNQLIGIIHVNENQCPIYIEIPENLNPSINVPYKTVYPLNLKDGMKKKGLKVQFSYTTSKAMSPEGCGAEAVIYLDQINVIP